MALTLFVLALYIDDFNSVIPVDIEYFNIDDFNTIPMELEDLNINWFDIVLPAEPLVAKIDPFYCKQCDKRFYKSGPFIQHNNVHHTVGKNIKCTVCGKRFSNEAALEEHSRKHKDESRFFGCQLCNKAYVI